MWIRNWAGAGAVCLAVVLAGCGDDKGSSASDSSANSESGSTGATTSASEGSASASMTATEPTEGGGSASMTGTTDISGSMSDSETMGGGSGNETDSASGTTGQDSQGGSGGSTTTTGEVPDTTGEPVNCAEAQTEEDCLALGCMPANGQQFEFDGAIWCLHAQPSFLGCLDPMACTDVISYICKGQNKYQVPSGCWPNGYQECDPPTDPQLGFPPC